MLSDSVMLELQTPNRVYQTVDLKIFISRCTPWIMISQDFTNITVVPERLCASTHYTVRS